MKHECYDAEDYKSEYMSAYSSVFMGEICYAPFCDY